MRLFLSDLHLESADTPAFHTLTALLARESLRCEALYLLGDLLEVWIGDDDDDELARAFVKLLAQTAQRCPVYLLHGNRDFLLGERFARATGVTLLPDPYLLADGTLLSHGDLFCTDDEAYQQLRGLLRSPTWQQDMLKRPLVERRKLAAAMREQSRAANANKAANIMDVNADEVAGVVAEHGAARLVHGHTHRPGIHRENWGERIVLGAWERCGWLLRSQQEDFRLECFPLAGRCESGTADPVR